MEVGYLVVLFGAVPIEITLASVIQSCLSVYQNIYHVINYNIMISLIFLSYNQY